MKGFFLKASVLKVISVIVAVLLWLYIIEIVDPYVDITVKNIPIRFSNQSILKENDLCLVSETNTMAELKLRGSRKKIAKIDKKEIYGLVNFENIDLENINGKTSVPVSIEMKIPYGYSEILSTSPSSVNVEIDKLVTSEKLLKVQTAGKVENGYTVGETSWKTEKVTLTGAQSVIDGIQYVGATLNLEGRTGDIYTNLDLHYVDKDGKIIEKDDYIYKVVSMEPDSVVVSCPVSKVESVPVEVNLVDWANAENYDISIQPSNVKVSAENDVLNGLDSIKTVLINPVNFGHEGKEVELLLPDGIQLEESSSKVYIKIVGKFER